MRSHHITPAVVRDGARVRLLPGRGAVLPTLTDNFALLDIYAVRVARAVRIQEPRPQQPGVMRMAAARLLVFFGLL